jgi:hypothetical protein
VTSGGGHPYEASMTGRLSQSSKTIHSLFSWLLKQASPQQTSILAGSLPTVPSLLQGPSVLARTATTKETTMTKLSPTPSQTPKSPASSPDLSSRATIEYETLLMPKSLMPSGSFPQDRTVYRAHPIGGLKDVEVPTDELKLKYLHACAWQISRLYPDLMPRPDDVACPVRRSWARYEDARVAPGVDTLPGI